MKSLYIAWLVYSPYERHLEAVYTSLIEAIEGSMEQMHDEKEFFNKEKAVDRVIHEVAANKPYTKPLSTVHSDDFEDVLQSLKDFYI